PLALAQRCSGLPAGAAPFAALLNYRHSRPLLLPGASLVAGVELLAAEEFSHYPLTVSVDDLGEGFRLSASVPPAVGAERLCQLLAIGVGQLLAALEAEAPISAVDLLDPAERRRLLQQFNDTARPFPRETPLHRLFERQVRCRPGAIAL